ncbi:peptide chain release factor N(5)-glutamine methyltransferase [Croceibacterium soli]|uniref:peptide chain release factor N(5)-glutamine methyltransferase n=1 Tax=Croceibacterium soli TaxID=1739690 RepID=UPI0022A7C13D|nr:peptide chain release factor N(5)-glutamine methyltransferase [Croceibacterium soli]
MREAARRLGTVTDTARLDAELLMAATLGVSRSDLLLWRMRDPVPEAFAALVKRRLAHEPVAQILGRKEFYGREFRVTRDVLIPRADSETTVAAAIEACPAGGRILDCGTGSGALLLTLLAELPQASGVGIDRSPAALAVAADNAGRLGLSGRAELRLGDWHRPDWRDALGTFACVIANPPYVEDDAELALSVSEYEPAEALFAGPDGLDDYQVLIPQLPALLAPGGCAVLEIGATQAGPVREIAAGAGFLADVRRDLGGRDRAVILRLGLGK